MFPRRRRLATTFKSALGVLTVASVAVAGNDDEVFVGNRAAMTGGAVSATVKDASATWYNPAGLGRVSETHVDVSGTAYTLRLYDAPGLLRGKNGQVADASVTEFLSVPSQVAFARSLGQGVTLGLGYFAPQASNFVLRESIRLEDAGAQSEWQVAASVARVVHTVGAGVGFSLTRRLRLGFALIGTYEQETRSVSLVSIFSRDGAPAAFAATSSLVTFSRFGLEAGVGFQLELSPSVTFAVTARTPRALLSQTRESSIGSGIALAQPGAISAEIAEPRQGTAGVHAFRAGRLGLALAFEPLPDGWVALEADVQPAVYNEQAGVDRSAVVNARLGGGYRISDSVLLGAGLFTDRSADRLDAGALNGRGDFYGGTLGMELRERYALARSEPAESMLLSTTLALKAAYSDGQLMDLVTDADPSAANSVRSSPGRMTVRELSLYLGGGVSF